MFDVGFWELALLGVVALIIIGPERLPGAAHTAGLWVAKGRRMLRDVKTDIDRELREQNVADLAALKKDFQSAGDEFKDATEKISASADVKADVEQAAASLKSSFEKASPLNKGEPSEAKPVKKTAAKKTTKKATTKKTAVAKKRDQKDKHYWVYVNQKKKTTKIHLATCSHCNHGRGQKRVGKPPPREYDQWHGPLSLEDARHKQETIGFEHKSTCGACM